MKSQDGGLVVVTTTLEDGYLAASPVTADADPLVIACPAGFNCSMEVKYVGIICTTQLVVDGSNEVKIATLSHHDVSADSDTTLLTGAAGAAGDLLTAVLDLNEVYTLYEGTVRLDPGDSIRAPLDVTTPDTAGVGYAFVVAYRVKEWSGE